MTALWSAPDALRATGGHGPAGWNATGVSIDSRTVARGDLFVALAGPRFDGHDFVGDALERGAAAAMIHRRPAAVSADAPLLTVPDTLDGLRALAAAARARSGAGIAAVTGSVGKTGTKEMLRLALATLGATHASAGNLNNHWGVPLSLARLPREAAYAVFELGMNHAGELTPLSRLVRPHVAVVTTIEAAHLEFFPSVEAIADAKAEIFAGVEPGGAAVLNADNPHFDRLAAAARRHGLTVRGFGRRGDAARLVDARATAEGMEVSAEIEGRAQSWRLGLSGAHWALNSLAVAATVAALGGEVSTAMAALADMTAPAGRGAQRRAPLPGGGQVTVIDESYNASPAAVRAALTVLATARPGPGGRRLLVLGDMLELGTAATSLHAELSEAVAAAGVDLVFTAGPLAAALHDALPPARRGARAASADALAPQVLAALRDGDVVLVKGSAGSRMGGIVNRILADTGLPATGDAKGGAR